MCVQKRVLRHRARSDSTVVMGGATEAGSSQVGVGTIDERRLSNNQYGNRQQATGNSDNSRSADDSVTA